MLKFDVPSNHFIPVYNLEPRVTELRLRKIRKATREVLKGADYQRLDQEMDQKAKWLKAPSWLRLELITIIRMIIAGGERSASTKYKCCGDFYRLKIQHSLANQKEGV